jgi:hypothetical protein
MKILKKLLNFLMIKLKTEKSNFFINNRINEYLTRQSIAEPKKDQAKQRKTQPKKAGAKMLTFSPEDFEQLQQDLTPLERAIDDAFMFGSNLQYSLMAWKTIQAMQTQTDEALSEKYQTTETLEAAKLVFQQNIQSFLLVSAMKQDLENVSA